LGPPTPRVDVSSRFTKESLGGGAVQYRYLDPTGDGGHGLIMAIDSEGTLGFEIRAEGDAATLGTGTDMFASGMQRLSADGVQVNAIRGYWMEDSGSVNLQQFTENLKIMDPQAAAANTWTGRIAGRYGYLQVSSPSTNMFGNTTVIFSKGTP